jgi:hypothetical protein
MKKIFLLCIILSSISILIQFKIIGYFNAESSLTYKFSKNSPTELRVHDNLEIEFKTKLSLIHTLLTKDDYKINSGISASTFPFHSKNINLFENYFLPLQIEITTFKELRNFDFIFENSFGIRNSIGIS